MEGGEQMTNEVFLLLSEDERQAKLRAVLMSRTEGGLTNEELEDILRAAIPKRQYGVKVYQDAKAFCHDLALPDGCRGRTILGQVMAGSGQKPGMLFCETRAAAVLIKNQAEESESYQIYIFIPPERLQKG